MLCLFLPTVLALATCYTLTKDIKAKLCWTYLTEARSWIHPPVEAPTRQGVVHNQRTEFQQLAPSWSGARSDGNRHTRQTLLRLVFKHRSNLDVEDACGTPDTSACLLMQDPDGYGTNIILGSP